MFTSIVKFNKKLFSSPAKSKLIDYYKERMIKLFAEVTTNRSSRIDTSNRNLQRREIYYTVCELISEFMSCHFYDGLYEDNKTSAKVNQFNLCLKILNNMLFSRFIDDKKVKKIDDKIFSEILYQTLEIIKTIQIENLHVILAFFYLYRYMKKQYTHLLTLCSNN